jgi:hypothetical protein
MSKPKAYAPEQGYKYQIFCKYVGDKELEHCDYATSRDELKYLIKNYKEAYGSDFSFTWHLLPKKYWGGVA